MKIVMRTSMCSWARLRSSTLPRASDGGQTKLSLSRGEVAVPQSYYLSSLTSHSGRPRT